MTEIRETGNVGWTDLMSECQIPKQTVKKMSWGQTRMLNVIIELP